MNRMPVLAMLSILDVRPNYATGAGGNVLRVNVIAEGDEQQCYPSIKRLLSSIAAPEAPIVETGTGQPRHLSH